MVRKEEPQGLSRQESFLGQISSAERAVISDLVGFLRAQRDGRLDSINWALFLAGDFADSFDHPAVVVDGIDLRLVIDAPMGSPIQRSFIEVMESAVNAHLAGKRLSYIQKTGDNWHMGRRSFDPDCREYERYADPLDRHNDIRFVIDPNQAENQRRIDVVINKFGGRDIETQKKWEKTVRQRQPVVLADTRYPTFHL
ncbi:MAG: hypothetical protein M1372_01335 [Patescibacteria group bacterium]|nr:hypothetical protein [Patescibacteria group bacterium]